MAMVVECESCRSSFRLNESLLKGSKAIRFRCRTCGGFIIVRNPEMRKTSPVPAPTLPLSSLPPGVPAAPATHPKPEKPNIASPPAPPDTYVEPKRPVPEDKSAPPPVRRKPEVPVVARKPAPPGAAGSIVDRLEYLVPFAPEGEVLSDRDTVGGTGASRRGATETRSTRFKIRAWAIGGFSFFAGLGILLLLASGAHYIWGAFDPWVKSPAKKATIPWSSNVASAPLKPAFDVQNLDVYIPKRAIAGNLFVITGTVRNVGNASSRGIRILATLFGKDNQVLTKQASIAGNHIDKSILPHMMRSTIEGYLTAARYEAGTGNYDIPPGNSLPFIVVCFNPPGKVESFKVLATNAEL